MKITTEDGRFLISENGYYFITELSPVQTYPAYDNYDIALTSITRVPITLAIITLDFCGRTFSVSPCLATGTPCYNTWKTCKYKIAYLKQSKDYKFSSVDTPLPFGTNERPYLSDITYLPTEIKNNLTITARTSLELVDEPDTDYGLDPYISQRTSTQGTFWKKLLARNTNYKGRQVKIYEGFLGLAENDFQLKNIGAIENITLSAGKVKIEIVDLLKSIASIEVPPKLDIKLVADITATSTEVTFSTIIGLDNPAGYIRIKDEIFSYSGLNITTNQLTGLQRGYFKTIAVEHKANDAIQKVRYYPPSNMYDILKEMLLTDAGISATNVDTAAFDFYRSWTINDILFSAIISEPTKLDKLYFEGLDLIDCKSWVAEDLKITIKSNIPNEPERAYFALADATNIIHNSTAIDRNESSRITRLFLYWDKTILGKLEEPKEYSRIEIAVDADAEGANEYNEAIEKKIFCRWLRQDYLQEETINQFVKNLIERFLYRYRDAQPIITFDVDLKDSDIKTGSYARISTDELENVDGTALVNEIFQVIKKNYNNSKINLKVLKLPAERAMFIAPNDAPDFDSATDDQKEYWYITGNDGLIDGKSGYYIQ